MNPPQIRALIFDMDGVISNTASLHYQSWQRLADEIGQPFSEKDYEPMLGMTRIESLRLFSADLAIDEATGQAWMARKNQYFQELATTIQPGDALPGIESLLAEAQTAGLALAVGSSSRNVHLVLGRLGLLEHFAVIGDGNTVINSKPAPDIFLWVAGALGCSPQEVLVIEDAPKGVQAALTGGFYVIGVGKANLAAAHGHYASLDDVSLSDLLACLPRVE